MTPHRSLNWLIVAVLLLPLLAGAPAAAQAPVHLRLATTTSTEDSGLLDYILPDFEQANNAKVDVVAVGTGQAIEIGTKGDADVLLVHARKQEDQFVANSDARERFDVMYNDFILLGPKEDPARVAGLATAKEAFQAIAGAGATFASRGDKSGTNTKENTIWASAGITPTADLPWYKSLGQGMGETLLFSNESKAYTLSDRGTYLSMKDKLPDLQVAVGGNSIEENKDKVLLNPYGVMAVNPDKHPGVNYDLAMKFVEWLTSLPTQEKIAGYGVDKFGQPLFYSDSAQWRAAHPPVDASGTMTDTAPVTGTTASAAGADLVVRGLVEKEMGWSEADVKAMPAVQVATTNNKGEADKQTGVALNALLASAGVKSGAAQVVLTGEGGQTAELAWSDVQSCGECILSFRSRGGFSLVLPESLSNGAKGVSLRGVTAIEVK